MNDKEFLHSLIEKYYKNREETQRENCIRCQNKGKLGKRKPYIGLCGKCRKIEFKQKENEIK